MGSTGLSLQKTGPYRIVPYRLWSSCLPTQIQYDETNITVAAAVAVKANALFLTVDNDSGRSEPLVRLGRTLVDELQSDRRRPAILTL